MSVTGIMFGNIGEKADSLTIEWHVAQFLSALRQPDRILGHRLANAVARTDVAQHRATPACYDLDDNACAVRSYVLLRRRA